LPFKAEKGKKKKKRNKKRGENLKGREGKKKGDLPPRGALKTDPDKRDDNRELTTEKIEKGGRVP